MKRFNRIVLTCGLVGLSASGWAATATTSFTVSGTVVPTCSVSAAPMSFGAAIPNPINTNVDVQSNVTATCSSGALYDVALSAGSGTFATRTMTSGVNQLNYNLYTTAARSAVWGDGTAGTTLVNGTGTGAPQAIPVFGRIPSVQNVPTGTYSDTIVVTLFF